MFLGVCYKYSREMGISLETLRILTIVATFFFSPLLTLYIIIGVINIIENSSPKQPEESTEYFTVEPAESEEFFDVTPAVSEEETIINGVRGEQAVINGVRED